MRGGRTRTAAMAALLVACGARSSLPIPEPQTPHDAGTDAGMDAGFDAAVRPPRPRDAGHDSGRDGGCLPGTVALETARVAIVFAIDRSESMLWAFDGMTPDEEGEPSRLQVLGDATRDALQATDSRFLLGGEFFPDDDFCGVRESLDVPIGAHHET